MNHEEKSMVALHVVSHLVRATLSKPNSPLSRQIARTMAAATGINPLELQRFQNSIVNERIFSTFKEERALEIARILLKTEILRRKEFPDAPMLKNLANASKRLKIPIGNLLETFREIYIEIIDEAFKKP